MLYNLQMNEGRAEQHQILEMLGKNVLPLFGLDNESATYPFVDLWGLPHGSIPRAQELAKALPTDSQVLNLFRSYKEMGYVTFPGIASLEQLESDIGMFLMSRATQSIHEGVTERQIYGKSYTWLALLFAVLASGAQNGSLPRKERELTSQVYSEYAVFPMDEHPTDDQQFAADSSVYASQISFPTRISKAYKRCWSSATS